MKDDTYRKPVEKWLNEIAYLFKSEVYQHENELRLFIEPVGSPSIPEILIDKGSSPPRVYIELPTIGGLILIQKSS